MSLPMIEAKYHARACGPAQFEESGNNNMQIAVPFEIIDEGGEHHGAVITWFATMHDKADKTGKTGRDRVLESLITMGWAGDDLSELVEIGDDAARSLMPEMVELVVAPDTYDGTTRLKVKWVNRAGAGRAGFKKPLGKGDLKAFSAQMKSTIRGVRGAAGTKPSGNGASKPAHPNAPGNQDDIPF